MTNAVLPVVIGGSPGTGKSTLARHLVGSEPAGVHLHTDDFYGYISQQIDPSTPAAAAQNETIIRAYCNAAQCFINDGYTVYVDGVIGPWVHPIILGILGPFHYLMLHASLAETTSRARQRNSQPSAKGNVLLRMHPQFEAVLDDFAACTVMTDHLGVEELTHVVRGKVATGECIVRSAPGAKGAPGASR